MARFISNGKGNEAQLRQAMKSYWQEYSPSIESMMLSQDATYLAENEQNEILSYLPNYSGKKVLELGAGIGRFTSKLATMAAHVTAVDFTQQYIDENQKQNQHLSNITFKCDDVTMLDFPAGSFDVVFSNWLFMYLSDEEVSTTFSKIYDWLTPGGYFFLRESCYHKSGNVKYTENPTLYRAPLDYLQMLRVSSRDKPGCYKIIRAKNILVYIQHNGNPNQLCFLVQQMENEESTPLKQHLESVFAINSFTALERVFGYNWCSTGGELSHRDFSARLGLRPGQRVLDVGCGTGGAATFMARHYGVHVHGVDLSSDMIFKAIERQGKLESRVKRRIQFEMSSIMEVDYEDGIYDVIYSKGTILYIKDKQELFKKFYRWLRPGGTLFIVDHCYTTSQLSPDLLNYIQNIRHQCLLTIESFVAQLKAAGFEDVKTQNLREDFIKYKEMELNFLTSTREAFIQEFSQNEFNKMFSGLSASNRWIKEGQFAWGAFTAHKRFREDLNNK
ncbi:phosphomethylethanolamine N-methyltransferase-like isoform X2 [Homarus americanus]|uniref:phosphomethylethanolamine N-methyltransferase-like isoform X2 n=1 Tax=Homarus americanus TaxID=6706 RepID=UPI001C468A13|nr:phosphomethylethanolamine N-methyltransferase-like isoform X2 [Homarus americanus]